MKMETRIAIDLDNTLCDLTGHVCKEISESLKLDTPINNSHIETYDHLQNTYGKWIEEFWRTPGIYTKHVSPLEGSQTFIRALIRKVGRFNIKIITSTPSGLEDEKLEFCKKHYGISNVEFSHEKWRTTKGWILIDDYWKHIVEHMHRNDGTGILFNYQGNYPYADAKLISFPDSGKVHKVTSYGAIIENLDKMEK
jgi:5'(3')-deoxyribonucleotidase